MCPLPLWFLQKCEKLVLSLCCNSLSLPFHEPVSPLVRRPLLVLPAASFLLRGHQGGMVIPASSFPSLQLHQT